jgi:hypothetical protein
MAQDDHSYSRMSSTASLSRVNADDAEKNISKLTPGATPWQHKEDVKRCPECDRLFGYKVLKHNCRSCGRVICTECSPAERKVRDWKGDQKVCNPCRDKSDSPWRPPGVALALKCLTSVFELCGYESQLRREQRALLRKGAPFRQRASKFYRAERLYLEMNSAGTGIRLARFEDFNLR